MHQPFLASCFIEADEYCLPAGHRHKEVNNKRKTNIVKISLLESQSESDCWTV